MTNIALLPPIVGEKNTTAEPKVGTAIKAVEEFLNSNKIDGTSNIKEEGVLEGNLSAALQAKLAATLTGVKIKTVTESTAAATGEFIIAGTAGITITLPAATINREVVVFNNAATAIKVKTTAGFFKGDFIKGSEAIAEVELLKEQHITVQADGTNWYIKAGEVKRTQTYTIVSGITKATAEAGVTPSAVRPSFVTLATISEVAKIVKAEIEVSGKIVAQIVVGEIPATSSRTMCSFEVLPGQVWKLAAGGAGISSFTSATLLK